MTYCIALIQSHNPLADTTGKLNRSRMRQFVFQVLILTAMLLGGCATRPSRANKPSRAEIQIALAVVLLEQGSHEQAKLAFDEAIALDSRLPFGYYGRGRLHRLRLEWDLAAADFDRAVALKPDYFEALSLGADTKFKLRRFDEAIVDADAAVALNPRMFTGYNTRGMIKEQRGDFAGAGTDYDRSIELAPNFFAYLHRARIRFLRGDRSGTLDDTNRAVALDPLNLEALADRGLARQRLGDFDGARVDYDTLVSRDPLHPGGYYYRGMFRRWCNDPVSALEDMETAVRLDPTYGPGYKGRALLRAERGQYQEAINDFDRAFLLDPTQENLLIDRGRAKRSLNDFKGALADFTAAIANHPKSPEQFHIDALADSYAERAYVFAIRGDFAPAMDDLDHLLVIRPQDADAYRSRASVFRALDQQAKAIADLDQAISLGIRHVELAYAERGHAKVMLRQYQAGLADLQMAATLGCDQPWMKEFLGRAKDGMGDWVGAIRAFDDVMAHKGKRDPKNDAYVLSRRAAAKRRLGDIDGAYADANRALELNPQLPLAYEERAATWDMKGEHRSALADYDHAMHLKPQLSAANYHLRGYLRAKVHDWNGAIDDLTRASEIDPLMKRNQAFLAMVEGDGSGLSALFENCRATQCSSFAAHELAVAELTRRRHSKSANGTQRSD